MTWPRGNYLEKKKGRGNSKLVVVKQGNRYSRSMSEQATEVSKDTRRKLDAQIDGAGVNEAD